MLHLGKSTSFGLRSSSRRSMRRLTLRQSLYSTLQPQSTLPEQYILRFRNVARLYKDKTAEEVLSRLHRASICVIGLGGVGSWVVEALARSGIGKLTLIDLDDICVSNINRQVMAQSSTVGQFKAEALKERVLEINPTAMVTTVLDFVTPVNVEDYLIRKVLIEENLNGSDAKIQRVIYEPKFDYVIDAADRVTDKAAIIHACVQSQTPIISSGGVGGLLDPTSIQINDLVDVKGDSLLMRVRRKLREAYDYPKLDNKTKLHPRKWYIRTVHSTGTSETSQFAQQIAESVDTASTSCNTSESSSERGGFRACDTTFGNACFSTGTLGFVIASEAINRIALDQMVYPKIPQRNRFIKSANIKINNLSDGGKSDEKAPSKAETTGKSGNDQDEMKGNHPYDCSCGKEFCQPSGTGRTLYEVLQERKDYSTITSPLFDAHCHLQLPPLFNSVQEELALCLRENISRIATCGTSPGEDWKRIKQLAIEYPDLIIPNYGLHPWWIQKYEEQQEGCLRWIEQLKQELDQNPLAGVGECGLDKNLKKQVPLEKQIQYLIPHIELACHYQRTLTLHGVSGSWGNLHHTLQKILSQEKERNPSNQLRAIVFHSCQSLPIDMLPMFNDLSKRLVDNRCFYSFAASSLLVPDERKASPVYQKTLQLLSSLPHERILLESDSPDQLPIFARDQQVSHNTPLIIKLACLELSKILRLSAEDCAHLTVNNAKVAFGLSF